METLKEIRDTEKKANELVEKAKKDSEALIAETKNRARNIIEEASRDSKRLSKEILEQVEKAATDETRALEAAFEDQVADHKRKVETNQNKAVKVILDSILPQK